MSKYDVLWDRVGNSGLDSLMLTYDEIEAVLGFLMDHSFLNYKKELAEYGYIVKKISMKKQTVLFERAERTEQ